MKTILSILVGCVILLACNLGTATIQTETPQPATAMPPNESTVLCTSAPVADSTLQIEQSPGCYLMFRGEQFTVTWVGELPADTQMVEFFRNCIDPDAPLMMCTDKATDSDGSDGYSYTFSVPQTFEEVIITAIAYGTSQGSSQHAGGMAIVIREE